MFHFLFYPDLSRYLIKVREWIVLYLLQWCFVTLYFNCHYSKIHQQHLRCHTLLLYHKFIIHQWITSIPQQAEIGDSKIWKLVLSNSLPSFAPFMSKYSLFPIPGGGNLFILNVRTACGSEHNCHNLLGGMSKSCQNFLFCWRLPWGLNAKFWCAVGNVFIITELILDHHFWINSWNASELIIGMESCLDKTCHTSDTKNVP